jgi:glycosyltransferase involved in cell wall biosynthesis
VASYNAQVETAAHLPATCPRVTVILATYNWSAVLPYSIGSVLRQGFSDFELLVVGDGCTDDSERVVSSIDDPRVRWIPCTEHSGHQSAPNNEGLRLARGELVAYIGHDDLWLPHHLDCLVRAFDAEGSDVVYSLGLNVGPDGGAWPTIPRPASGGFSSPLCMMHRLSVTRALGGWRDYRELAVSPDVELWRRLQAAGRVFTFVPRLTGVKFPASWRRGVYATRPCHEQAAWSSRIQSDPDFEVHQLVDLLAGRPAPTGMPYREILHHLWRQTAARVRRQLSLPFASRGTDIDAIRRFKGL